MQPIHRDGSVWFMVAAFFVVGWLLIFVLIPRFSRVLKEEEEKLKKKEEKTTHQPNQVITDTPAPLTYEEFKSTTLAKIGDFALAGDKYFDELLRHPDNASVHTEIYNASLSGLLSTEFATLSALSFDVSDFLSSSFNLGYRKKLKTEVVTAITAINGFEPPGRYSYCPPHIGDMAERLAGEFISDCEFAGNVSVCGDKLQEYVGDGLMGFKQDLSLDSGYIHTSSKLIYLGTGTMCLNQTPALARWAEMCRDAPVDEVCLTIKISVRTAQGVKLKSWWLKNVIPTQVTPHHVLVSGYLGGPDVP